MDRMRDPSPTSMLKPICHKLRTHSQKGDLDERIVYSMLNILKQLRILKAFYSRRRLRISYQRRIKAHFQGRQQILSNLNRLFPDFSGFAAIAPENHRFRILEQADQLLAGRYTVLNYDFVFSGSIDWHTDMVSGFRWEPGLYYKRYNEVDLGTGSDIKNVRELNRCSHFLIFGQAYLLTGKEAYAREIVTQILNWIDENKFMTTINWCCTMDVAIRAVNWIYALAMIKDARSASDAFFRDVLTSLYEHGLYIYLNPEKARDNVNNNNHYISDLTGQIYIALLLHGLPETSKWLAKGISELFGEMRNQILPSGPHYERSTNYHRLVLELVFSTAVLLERTGHEIPLDIRFRIETMMEFVMYYTRPDHYAPIIGDQDDGRLHKFGSEDSNDHRSLLSSGAIWFQRSDFKYHSGGYSPDAFFLFGAEGQKRFSAIPNDGERPLTSKAFPDAGFYIMRQGSDYMFINNSGMSCYCETKAGTHTHSDLLSFELSLNGQSLLIDPGSCVYSSDPGLRQLFRSTSMHNTVTIDSQDQNQLFEDKLWMFQRDAVPSTQTWVSNTDQDLFLGLHTGYSRLIRPVIHKRRIVFSKKKRVWTIEDSFDGNGSHLIEWFFHFNIGIDFEINDTAAVTTGLDVNLCISFEAVKPILSKESAWVSRGYNHKSQGAVLKASLNSQCPVRVTVTLEPC